MELLVLNENFESIYLIDTFKSAIWTDRFNEAGDFEVVMRFDPSLLDVIKLDHYLIIEESDRVMIIEDIDISTDEEEGPLLMITGRSLEQILDRRIVLNMLCFENKYSETGADVLERPNLQNALERIFNENIISPAISSRRIDNFIFEKVEEGDPDYDYISQLTFEAQFYGDNIYDVVKTLCQNNDIGFKVTLSDNNEMVFRLYTGVDRTFTQYENNLDKFRSIFIRDEKTTEDLEEYVATIPENQYVIFSKEFDNLLSSSYYKTKSSCKNVAIVAGEVENPDGDADTEIEGTPDGTPNTVPDRMVKTVMSDSNAIGIARREIFSDASSVKREVDEDTTLTETQYEAKLRQNGINTLIENMETEAFEGEIEPTINYEYGKHFLMGDVVQLVDEYGNEGQAYISELIISHDAEKIAMYPTFVSIQKGEYEIEQDNQS